MFRSCLCVLLWVVFLVPPAFGQLTTATISGLVKDTTGAVLPGVTFTIKNLDTGITRSVIADDQGRYRGFNLGLGNYEVQAELPGFQTAVRTGIELTVGREAVVDFVLKVGEVTEKVVVSGEAPLLETTSSTVAGLVTSQQMTELPLNGRDFTQLALLETGTVNLRNTDSAVTKGYGTRISISGSRPSQTAYLLDGTDISSFVNFGVPGSAAGVILGVDAVREFQVQVSNFSAEFGRTAGGVLNMASKSGTNQFHGTLFEFHRNDNLDARNFFATRKPEFKRNQFGFSAGGPVAKDSAFFFGSYEALKDRKGLSLKAFVPDENARRGFLPGVGTGGLREVGVNPVVKLFLDQLYPLPNGPNIGGGVATLFHSGNQSVDEDFFTVRVDRTFPEKDFLFARYNFDNGEQVQPEVLPISSRLLSTRTQYATVEEQHIFSSRSLNTFRFAYNRTFLAEFAELIRPITATFRSGYAVGALAVGGLSEAGTDNRNPRVGAQNLFQWTDTLSLTRGAHSLKIGVDMQRIQFNEDSGSKLRGTFNFRNLEDFLLGKAQALSDTGLPGSDALRGWRQTLVAIYAQDDMKAARKLTLNLGLRYEFYTVPTEVNGKLSHIRDYVKDTGPTLGNPFWDNPSLTSFAPRLGLAWDPFGDGKTSVRAGYGIFYVMITPRVYRTVGSRTEPFYRNVNVQDPVGFPSIDAVIANELAKGQLLTSPYAFQFRLNSTYEQKFNLTLEREIFTATVLTAGYIGGRAIHLHRHEGGNTSRAQLINGRWVIPPGTPVVNPNFSAGLISIRSDSQSFYNAFQLRLNQRLTGGLLAKASYTYSKTIDDSGVDVATTDFGQNQGQSQNPALTKGDRALSPLDARHGFSLSWLYEVPVGAGKQLGGNLTGAADKLLSGWQVNGIVNFSSGTPSTVSLNFANAPAGRIGYQRPDLAPGRNSNPINPGNPDQYFDPEAFVLPPANAFGNLGRNTLIGPGFAGVDFGLMKNTAIRTLSENFAIQFRAEIFNLLNRANFGQPSTDVLSRGGIRLPGAGKITRTVGTEREIQLGLKVIW